MSTVIRRKSGQIIYPESLIFVFLACLLNILLYWFGTDHAYYSPDPMHAEVGYNVYHFNSIKRNSEIGKQLQQLKQEGLVPLASNKLVDPVYLTHNFSFPQEYNAITDTVGYGVLLGLIWKVTHSLRYRDVQYLQIGIFSLLMMLIYSLAMLFFNVTAYARSVSTLFLFFFPLISLNAQALRDIWSYYGIVVLLFVLVAYCTERISIGSFALGVLFFCACQWIRPTLSLALMTLPLVFGVAAWFKYFKWQQYLRALFVLYGINILFFWLPFMAYNKIAYDRYLVGPVGQDLIEGLGEFPNPWGFQLSDSAFIAYITETYHPQKKHGTPEFDDYGIVAFKQACAQDPWFYVTTLVRRLPQIMFPALPFIFHETSAYASVSGIYAQVMHSCSSLALFFDFIARHIFIRFLLLLGWIGALYMVRDRQWFILTVLFIGVMCVGYGKFPSHIEYRYLTPFYWPMLFFAAYFLCRCRGITLVSEIVNKKV